MRCWQKRKQEPNYSKIKTLIYITISSPNLIQRKLVIVIKETPEICQTEHTE